MMIRSLSVYRTVPLVAIMMSMLGLLLVESAYLFQTEDLKSAGWEIFDGGLPATKISMVSDSDGWAAIFGFKTTSLYRWDGSSWNYVDEFNHADNMFGGDIAMVSADDGWIVRGELLGEDASSVIYRWNGVSWNQHMIVSDPNEIQLSALDVVSASDVWAVGGTAFGSNFYHWNGSNWQLDSKIWLPLLADNDLEMVSANDGWAVGLLGGIMRWNGSKWNSVSSPVSTSLNGISFVTADDGWVVGGSQSDPAVIIHWDGSTWTEVASPVTDALLDISMVSADDGWAVGDNGVILHWDGTSWKKAVSPTFAMLTDVDMMSAADGWIAGNDGILRYYPPELASNYSSGAQGSYFTLTGSGFPLDSAATITVNGQTIGNLSTDSQGDIEFILSTTNADEGTYFVTTTVNPSATVRLILDQDEPVRPQEGASTILEVPAGIAFTESVYLPIVRQ